MKVWVCRTGKEGQFQDVYSEKSSIFLTRDGFDFNLSEKDKECIIERLNQLIPGAAKQTISNSWSQVDIFVNQMEIGDLVLIPHKKSSLIDVAKIVGDYTYTDGAPFPLVHQRSILFLGKSIDTRELPQSVKYSMGAFRSLFQIKQVEDICSFLQEEGVRLNEI